MMRRGTESKATGHSMRFSARAAPVAVHAHGLISIENVQQNASSENASAATVATAGAGSVKSNASGPLTSSTPTSANTSTPEHVSETLRSNTSSMGNGTGAADKLSTPNKSASSQAILSNASVTSGNSRPAPPRTSTQGLPPGPFVLRQKPVIHMHHQLTTIVPEQWPPNFCVNIKMDAPLGNTPERRRCIVLFGGGENSSCGLFNIYINDINEVGMGERCKNDLHSAEGPLLNDDGGLASNTTHSLKFCYNTLTGAANIWKEGKMMVSGVKRWNFTRRGFVSVFVGSHVLESVAEGLFEEDKATLYELSFTDNSTTPTTTVGPSFSTTAEAFPTVTVTFPSTTPLEEVDVNQTNVTAEEAGIVARIIGEMKKRKTTTPKPRWNRTHHFEQGNLTATTDNTTVVTHDVRTVVTDSETATRHARSHIFSMPGAPAANSSAHNVTIHIDGTAAHSTQTDR